MRNHGVSNDARRVLTDFLLAFVLFWTVSLSLSAGHSRAHAVPLPVIASAATLLSAPDSGQDARLLVSSRQATQLFPRRQPTPGQAQLLLSLVFAAMVALNLAFWRHLRRVYASPRRSMWRRG